MNEQTDVKTTCFPLALDNCDGKLQCTMVQVSHRLVPDFLTSKFERS